MGDVSPQGSVKLSWGRLREEKTGGARTVPRTEATALFKNKVFATTAPFFLLALKLNAPDS